MSPRPTACRLPRRRQLGATAAEFAVILPLVVTVMIGSIEAGRMVVSRAMLSYASIAGGRAAAVTGTADQAAVKSMVLASAPMLGLTAGDVNITVQGVNTPAAFLARTAGNQVTVAVTYQFQPMLNLPGLTIRTWTATTQAVVE